MKAISFPGRPVQIDCDAIRDLTLIRFDRATAGLLMRQDAFFANRLMCSVALKMHLMGSDLVSIAYETPLTRLKLCIASLANAEGGHINNEDAPELVVSQMELAELVGVHRVSVGRLLQRMQNESLVEIRRGRLSSGPLSFQTKTCAAGTTWPPRPVPKKTPEQLISAAYGNHLFHTHANAAPRTHSPSARVKSASRQAAARIGSAHSSHNTNIRNGNFRSGWKSTLNVTIICPAKAGTQSAASPSGISVRMRKPPAPPGP